MTIEQVMTELAPCPFCGGKAELIDLGDSRNDSYVHCTTATCEVQQIAKYDELGATRAWNCRAGHASSSNAGRRKLAEAEEQIERLNSRIDDLSRERDALREFALAALGAKP